MATPFESGRGDSRREPATRLPPRSVDEGSSGTVASRRRSPLTFVLLVFALSIPYWLAGAVAELQMVPGLPVVDALIVVCPLLAASILVYRENKSAVVWGPRTLARSPYSREDSRFV